MKPGNLKSQIFLDSGDATETEEIFNLLGFLDGQTTNPTLIAKSPVVQAQRAAGKKINLDEIASIYKSIISQIHSIIPDGKISIEVNASKDTTSEEMFSEAMELSKWIPKPYIKYPITSEGLKAAEMTVKKGICVNMTLCFTEEQAAAVYTATQGAAVGSVFISPFIGRLDDKGGNGMDLIKNLVKLYSESDHHVGVLAASVRTVDHLLASIQVGADAITAPYKVLKAWGEMGMPMPEEGKSYSLKELADIPFEDIDITKPWDSYNILHELTQTGVDKFSQDWIDATS